MPDPAALSEMIPADVGQRDGGQGADGVLYRAEGSDDHGAIAEVVAAAFGSPAEADLVADIRASEHFIAELSIVAQRDEQIVGHVMVSYATLLGDGGEHRIAMLSPLAVDPAFRRRGIGSALVRTVTAEADALGEPLVILEGSPRFYGASASNIPYATESRSHFRRGRLPRPRRSSACRATPLRSAAT